MGKDQGALANPRNFAVGVRIFPTKKYAYPAGPTTTTPCGRGPRPREGLNVILRMPSLTVFTDDVATPLLEFDSIKFLCPCSSQVI
jgi:hypothetical protein